MKPELDHAAVHGPPPLAEPAPNMASRSALKAASKNPTNPPPRPWVVLVVDDEPDVLDSMKGLLEQSILGSKILTANSGAQALTMLDRVDLIIADYRMPQMDGIGFLAYCMRLRPTATRILITAFPGPVPELENRARREANVAAFVSKGLGPQALIEAVRKVMYPEPVRPLDVVAATKNVVAVARLPFLAHPLTALLLVAGPTSESGASGGKNGAVNTPQKFVWRETFSQPFAGSRNFTWRTDGQYGAQIEWVFIPAAGTQGGVTLNIRCGVGEKHQHLLGYHGKLSSTQLGPPGTWQLNFEVESGYQGDIEVTLTSI